MQGISAEAKQGYSEAELDAIRATGARILAHPSFRSSERSSRLFQFLLNRTISGEAGGLKERLIGHEVFGREIGYDTALDPVVRNAASETRKRLRQYDSDEGSHDAVHIILPSGSYVLEFRFDRKDERGEPGLLSTPSTDPLHAAAATAAPITQLQTGRTSSGKLWALYALIVSLGLCCVVLAGALLRERSKTAQLVAGADGFDALWGPMLLSEKEIFISIGHAMTSPQVQTFLPLTGARERVTVTELKAYTHVSGFLQMHRRSFQMRTDTETTLQDLKDRSIVLIGNGNNEWALRLTQNLRYRFDLDDAHKDSRDRVFTIIDSQHPDQKRWSVNIYKPQTNPYDYAIVGRFFNPVTGGLVLYFAGAGPGGTEAASEFVTQDRFLKNLPDKVNNPRTNFEVVLRTPMIADVPGSPEVIATDIQ